MLFESMSPGGSEMSKKIETIETSEENVDLGRRKALSRLARPCLASV